MIARRCRSTRDRPGLRGGLLMSSMRLLLRSRLLRCQSDAISGHIGRRVARRQKIEILLGYGQLAVGSDDVGVFRVLAVQGPELPARL